MEQAYEATRRAFSQTLLRLAKNNRHIVAMTSDSRGSVTLNAYAEELPEQYIEMGIAEQNLVSAASGLTSFGFVPFVCSPACFLSMRSIEQVKVDVAYSATNVKLIGISAGVSYGALGMSHHSLQDFAVMRAIPNLAIIAPCDAVQTEAVTEVIAAFQGPVYVRLGRNPVSQVYAPGTDCFQWGKAVELAVGNDVTIIATGEVVQAAVTAAKQLRQQGIKARVLNMHTIKPLDNEAVLRAARETRAIITVEEHSVMGGLGGAVAEVLGQHQPCPLRIMAIADEVTPSGSQSELLAHYGLDAAGITACVTGVAREAARDRAFK